MLRKARIMVRLQALRWLRQLAAPALGAGAVTLAALVALLALSGAPHALAAAPHDASPAPTAPGPVRLTVPPSGAVGGSTITAFLTGWSAPDGSAPTTVAVTTQDPEGGNSGGATRLSFTIASHDGASYALNVALPKTLSPGKYWMTFAGASGTVAAISDAFQVVAPSEQAPAAASTSAAGPPWATLIGGVVLVLLAAGIVYLVLSQRQRSRPV